MTGMDERQPYALDDPTVLALGRFLQAAPLSDGRTTTGLGSPTTELLAQAVVNWAQGLVWSDGAWVDRAQFESLPEVGDVEIETLAGGEVVRMTHRATGVTALGETHDDAWSELKRKVTHYA